MTTHRRSHLRRRSPFVLLVAVLATLAALALPAPAQAAAPALPVRYSTISALAGSVSQGGAASPPGANDWNCRPSAARPEPVVLVHGTFANMRLNWDSLSPLLKNDGYCVFALNYGGLVAGQIGGLGAMPASAAELGAFVDRVLAATGASKVDIVGHSQGGSLPRYYVNFLGGDQKVDDLVGLAPSSHGTTLLGLGTLANLIPGANLLVGAACASCRDQVVDSPFNRALTASGDTRPGVTYTVIATRYDQVVTPYRTQFLEGANVTNILVQNGCFLNATDHLSIAFDRRALTYVLNALDPANPRRVPCALSLPFLGG